MLDSTTLKELEDWGMDLQGTMARMLGDVGFFEMCLGKFHKDENFARLGDQLQRGDIMGAFTSAHTLKGITATLGILPINKPLSEIVEVLRRGDLEGTAELYEVIMRKHGELGYFLGKHRLN